MTQNIIRMAQKAGLYTHKDVLTLVSRLCLATECLQLLRQMNSKFTLAGYVTTTRFFIFFWLSFWPTRGCDD